MSRSTALKTATATALVKQALPETQKDCANCEQMGTLKNYLLDALKESNAQPPDTEYQRGFLGALLSLFEDLCMTGDERMQHRILTTAQIDCLQKPRAASLLVRDQSSAT